MTKFDVIIIGSGLGGLETAYILSKNGLNVCVLEQGKQLGGSIQNFARDGVIFDTGAHYVGALDKGQTLYKYFDYFNLNEKLKLKRLDEDCFDEISFGDDGSSYSHALGFDNFKEKLIECFPSEKESVNSYVNDLQTMGQAFPLFNLGDQKAYQNVSKYTHVGIKQYLDSISSNQRYKNVLAGSNLLYAGEENKTPLYVHGLICNSYIQSSYRFVGGSGQIAYHLTKSIKNFGGTVLRNRRIVKLEMADNKVEKAITSNNEIFSADHFISNVHPNRTFEMLPKEVTKKVYFKRVANIEPTPSVFTLYITFKENSFKYLNRNYYHHRENKVWTESTYDKKDWPKNFLFLTQVPKDLSEYAEGATVMTFMNYNEFEKWEGTEIDNRPEEYNNLKLQREETLLDLVEERFPGIRKCIKSVYSSTPLTYHDYTATYKGSIYGAAKDFTSIAKSTIMPNTKIKNLFLTGQNVNLHGVLGVTVGSILTSSKLIGMETILQDIK